MQKKHDEVCGSREGENPLVTRKKRRALPSVSQPEKPRPRSQSQGGERESRELSRKNGKVRGFVGREKERENKQQSGRSGAGVQCKIPGEKGGKDKDGRGQLKSRNRPAHPGQPGECSKKNEGEAYGVEGPITGMVVGSFVLRKNLLGLLVHGRRNSAVWFQGKRFGRPPPALRPGKRAKRQDLFDAAFAGVNHRTVKRRTYKVQFVPRAHNSLFAVHEPFHAVLADTKNPRILKLLRSATRPGKRKVKVKIGRKLLERLRVISRKTQRPIRLKIEKRAPGQHGMPEVPPTALPPRASVQTASTHSTTGYSTQSSALPFHPAELHSLIEELMARTKEATELILDGAGPAEYAFVRTAGEKALRALQTIDHGMEQNLADEIRRGLSTLLSNLNDLRHMADAQLSKRRPG